MNRSIFSAAMSVDSDGLFGTLNAEMQDLSPTQQYIRRMGGSFSIPLCCLPKKKQMGR